MPQNITISPGSIAVLAVLLATFFGVRFALWYLKARRQFPGPRVKNIWTGNLDQVLADDVHEKVSEYHLTQPMGAFWTVENIGN